LNYFCFFCFFKDTNGFFRIAGGWRHKAQSARHNAQRRRWVTWSIEQEAKAHWSHRRFGQRFQPITAVDGAFDRNLQLIRKGKRKDYFMNHEKNEQGSAKAEGSIVLTFLLTSPFLVPLDPSECTDCS